MRLRIDPTSGVPLGHQISRQIRLAVAAGRLTSGERLPPARELAATLGVNVHTVLKAYADLARDGLLDVGQGRGTFVSAEGARLSATDLRDVVRQNVGRLASELAGSSIDPERIEELVVDELRRALGMRVR